MPPELVPSDDEYASEEDSDFSPDAAPTQEDADSSDEESEAGVDDAAAKSRSKGTGRARSSKRKRADVDGEEAEDAGFENSGDEAIIEKGLRSRKKKGKKGHEDEDEGGEGGLIKTRSMRAQEKIEKQPLVNTDAATVDVDSLWAAMISGKPAAAAAAPAPSTENKAATLSPTKNPPSPSLARKESRSPSSTLTDGPDAMIMIKRTYAFAGKVHVEQKLVPRNSAEAKLYLATQPDPSPSTNPSAAAAAADPSSPFTKPKRPLRTARRSIFEPATDSLPRRTDLHFGARKDGSGVLLVGGAAGGREKKLNTVEKSALDWAGFVDKEGIKDELDAAGKSKGAYRARQEFLARVEDKREEEARRARGVVRMGTGV